MRRKLAIDERDIGFIFDDLHRGRSIVPPHALVAKPALTRWDIREPLSLVNCVVLSRSDIQRLNEKGGIGEDVEWWGGKEGEQGVVSGEVVTAVVRRRQEEARRVLDRL